MAQHTTIHFDNVPTLSRTGDIDLKTVPVEFTIKRGPEALAKAETVACTVDGVAIDLTSPPRSRVPAEWRTILERDTLERWLAKKGVFLTPQVFARLGHEGFPLRENWAAEWKSSSDDDELPLEFVSRRLPTTENRAFLSDGCTEQPPPAVVQTADQEAPAQQEGANAAPAVDVNDTPKQVPSRKRAPRELRQLQAHNAAGLTEEEPTQLNKRACRRR